MENLIKTLHAQHRAIATVADEITAQLAAGNTQEVRSGLVRLKNELVAHLELEDAHLYPVLTKVAEATQSLVSSRVALTYERNMQHVSAALRAFLEQYTSNEDVRIEELRLDWNLVVRMLLDRIESEEEQLYPLYEEWVLGNADR